jgi:Xaa-Pro aminopeptidase
MTASVETLVRQFVLPDQPAADALSDRRADVDAKQARVADLLREVACDGLLAFEPESFAWLTSGASSRGVLDPAAQPALYFSPDQRWLLASNVDAQRLFDEELDGLGFQLKQWSWHRGRDRWLADLAQGRRAACDRGFGHCKPVGEELRRLRRLLTVYEQACYRALGLIVSHALEATCRTLKPDETEREIAGQLSHRLVHRGALPVDIQVAGDGRSRLYRQCGFTSAPVHSSAVLTVTARKYGLCATASRSLSFRPADAAFLREHDAACKITAAYVACTWPDAVPRQILATGRRVYRLTGFEHEWLLSPQGHLTGRAPVELTLLPDLDELLQAGWAVTWQARVGAATSCDTFLTTDEGPAVLTPTETWPLKRIRIQGAEFFRPDVLQR